MTRRPTKAPPSERWKIEDRPHTTSRFLYGREGDIALIDGLLDRARGSGSALVISGEPGIGKSTLLDAAHDLAHDRGMRVLRLCGVTSESHLPFGALQQAIAPILKRVDKLPARQRSALQAAFGLSDDPIAPDIFLVALATLTLLTASAARKPILLAADDVQWLDPPSRDVLSFISRRLGSDPIVLLVTIREGSENAFPISGVALHKLSRLDAVEAERARRYGRHEIRSMRWAPCPGANVPARSFAPQAKRVAPAPVAFSTRSRRKSFRLPSWLPEAFPIKKLAQSFIYRIARSDITSTASFRNLASQLARVFGRR